MKTILLIFSVFLLPISLFGQTTIRKSDFNPLMKSTNGMKQRLDSIVSSNGYKIGAYSYDSRGNNIISNEKWCHYDESAECTYDSVGKLKSIYYGETKVDLTYNSMGNILTFLLSVQDYQNNSWIPNSKDEYNYDTSTSRHFTSGFPNYSTWFDSGEEWFFKYNSFGDIEYILLAGRFLQSPEDGYDKIEFQYDGIGKMISKIYFGRDSLTEQWKEDYKVLFAYDEYSNIVESTYSPPYYATNCGIIKSVYKYDNTYSFNDLYLPYKYYGLYNYHLQYWKTDFIKHKRTERIDYTYDKDLGQWVKGETYKYYYSEHTITGIVDATKEELMVYPNPSQDQIIFDINTNNEPSIVELYDSQGRMVIKEEIPQDKRIQVKHLPRGLYIYRLNYQNTVRTGKIVLQ